MATEGAHTAPLPSNSPFLARARARRCPEESVRRQGCPGAHKPDRQAGPWESAKGRAAGGEGAGASRRALLRPTELPHSTVQGAPLGRRLRHARGLATRGISEARLEGAQGSQVGARSHPRKPPTLPVARTPLSPSPPLRRWQHCGGPQRESLGEVIVGWESGYTQRKAQPRRRCVARRSGVRGWVRGGALGHRSALRSGLRATPCAASASRNAHRTEPRAREALG